MELYIEKEFLDNFYLEFEEGSADRSQQILSSIFREYGEIDSFINTEIKDEEALECLKANNPFFANLAIHFTPKPIKSVKDHFFEHSKCIQTIILTENVEPWYEQAEQKGALCLSFNNYREKIEEMIDRCHFKIDLSEGFKTWDVFSFFQFIPFNDILFNDNYILTNKKDQSMDKNIIPLLKVLLDKKREDKTSVKIFTKNLGSKVESDEYIKVAVRKRHKRLNSSLANYGKKIQIINNGFPICKNDFHDRTLLSNFICVDAGKGFNLIPSKGSNSQIVVESIFNKYTYKRIKNLKKMYNEYFDKVQSLESVKFTIYPS